MGSVFARLCQSVGWDFHGRAVLCGYEYPPVLLIIMLVTTVGSPLRGDYQVCLRSVRPTLAPGPTIALRDIIPRRCSERHNATITLDDPAARR